MHSLSGAWYLKGGQLLNKEDNLKRTWRTKQPTEYLVDLASIIYLYQRLSHANVRPNFLTFNLLMAQYKSYILVD